ncbi:MAG TPA: GAF domain-containing protein [Thermomicrobiales bacterium]|nr:GAF domain-containing protein [Thermomicrobiales bacterium]
MSEKPASPIDALAAMMAAVEQDASTDGGPARRAAHRMGEACAASDLTIEETFEILEREAGEALTDFNAEVLGSIVRGYVDQVVRVRGLTRRRGTGRLSSHVSRLAALHRINRAATASLRLDEMLSTVVEVIAETIDGDACSVFLADPSAETLMLRATVGLNPEAIGRLAIRSDAGITGLAASSRQTQIAVNASQHPAYFTYPIVGEDRYTSQVSIPLLLREPERLVGVLNIQSLEERIFDQDEITFLETAAGELSIAIENARLYSQTDAALHRRISELHQLRSVARSLTSMLRSDELLPLIASQAATIMSGNAATIARVLDDGDTSRIDFLASFPESDGDQQHFPDELIRTVYSSRTAIVMPESGDDETHNVVLGAPLMTGHGVFGAVCVRLDAAENHTDDKLGLFQSYADSAALALENAALYDEARRGYSTASTLLQEMHHRVRNNLQTVAALLSMQARHARYAEWTAPLQEAVARVQSIAAVHSLLSSDNVTSATIASIVKHVVDEASINVVPPGVSVTFNIEPSDIEASSRQATILALLINECVTNAIEHGMEGRERGKIDVSIHQQDGTIEVVIEDDGNGLTEGFSVEHNSRLGLRIAQTLASSDLGGSYSLQSRPGGGASSIIRFPAWQR